ncbi:glycogen debranching protein GlgX [Beutenbergia cavernae]|nr:glycogen debranching protein GlgX [Beutenbergia cavernae]
MTASPQTVRPAARAARGASLPHRFGAHVVDGGIDVVVAAPHAEAVDLCLLGDDGERRVGLRRRAFGVWDAHVPGVGAGQRYGLRVHGPWDPAAGLFHNPAKLLLDPYARGVVGDLRLSPEIFGHVTEADGAGDLALPDHRDSAPFVRHGVVVPSHRPPVRRPRVPWSETVVYEAHVRGLTLDLPGVPEHLRGTYAGLAHPATIEHLRRLGVTTLELLPIHAIASETALLERGLVNYWGYSTLAFFAPEPRYATTAARSAGPAAVLAEVTGMVSLLHDAGIEVLLDVVYNHTCEQGLDGPLLSWRGLDNTGYYLHDGSSPARYADVTGTGNSLDFRRQRVVQLALDSLRYWAEEVGVDGFRFDLAVTLGRRAGAFEPDHPFLVALASDPTLGGLKLVAEPWDVGPSGWRTGAFLPPMREWNDRFRDATRRFWLADPRTAAAGDGATHDLRDLATRLSGSADLFGHGGGGSRGPLASVNYVTAHDGFTLADLVAYDHKHNEANGEGGRDGSDHNLSWNHGIEGPVRDEDPGGEILPLRRRSIRNLLATLLVSAGVPMLTAGDEVGRTQRGNNNAYCQDSELSWVSWEISEWRSDLLATSQYLLALRREHAALRPVRFARGRPRRDDTLDDLAWFGSDGTALDHDAWHDPARRLLQMRRSGRSLPDPLSGAEPAEPAAPAPRDVLVVLNGALEQDDVVLAPARTGWELVWDSTWEHPGELATSAINGVLHPADGSIVPLDALSMRIYLERRTP